MVRLVFRPYTQVRRSICTSESLRASTRVSPGFALLRHSSPSFGSRRARSRSAPPTTRPGRAGGAPATPRGDRIPPGPSRGGPRFHCACGFRTTPRLARAPDSLVRVSRRVGRITDVVATDPRRPETSQAVEQGRSAGTVAQSPPVEAPTLSPAARTGARKSLGPLEAGPDPRRGYNGRRPPEGGHPLTFLAGLMAGREPVVALGRRKVHPAGKRQSRRDGPKIRARQLPIPSRAEFRRPTLRVRPFTSGQFHVLLNSLFKVLFNLPSRYLSAIGLAPVFSLRWSLPPTLGCIPKQPDS